MDLAKLHNKLIAAARTVAPDERVPYAFEKRIMARLGVPARAVDAWAVWNQALWKAALACVAITTLCAAWSTWSHHQPIKADVAQEFDSAVFASAATDEAW